jgi:hypothetical protein
MTDDDGPFGTEERRQAGLAMATFMDALEDEDIKTAILEVRTAVRNLQDLYVNRYDIDDHNAVLSITNTALGTLIAPPQWEGEGPQ